MPLIRVRGLRKEFRVFDHDRGLLGAVRNLFRSTGRVVAAVDGLEFEIEAGEFVGCVGPNGAGKSTTVKMLSGILVPTAGEVEVGGLVPWRNRKAHARRIGLVFGQRTQLWWDLPPSEAFHLLGKIYRVDPARYRDDLSFLTERFSLGPFLDTPVRKLSLGQRMRCEIAAALLHDPAILFLDEPTIGLDVVAKEEVRSILATINRERGTTILLTSHDLDDIERLCGRVLLIDRGRILHDGSVASLKTSLGHRRRIVFDFVDEVVPGLPEGATVARSEGKRLTVEFDADRLRAPEVISHVLARHAIHDLSVQELDIEEVVRRIYVSRS